MTSGSLIVAGVVFLVFVALICFEPQKIAAQLTKLRGKLNDGTSEKSVDKPNPKKIAVELFRAMDENDEAAFEQIQNRIDSLSKREKPKVYAELERLFENSAEDARKNLADACGSLSPPKKNCVPQSPSRRTLLSKGGAATLAAVAFFAWKALHIGHSLKRPINEIREFNRKEQERKERENNFPIRFARAQAEQQIRKEQELRKAYNLKYGGNLSTVPDQIRKDQRSRALDNLRRLRERKENPSPEKAPQKPNGVGN